MSWFGRKSAESAPPPSAPRNRALRRDAAAGAGSEAGSGAGALAVAGAGDCGAPQARAVVRATSGSEESFMSPELARASKRDNPT